MFSVIYNYLGKKPPFSCRYHLSCPITVDIMRFSPAKVSHLPCDTPPITHAHRMTFTEASYLLLSHKPRWWAIFCSAGASISFSLKLLSLFFFFFSLLLYFPRYCQAIFNLVNFSLILGLFQKIFQSQCEMTLTGAAVAAYIVQFRISLLFIQVTGRGTKMLWQSPGTMRITLTLVVFSVLDKMLRKQLY